jgi:general secretion pathway protein C
MLVTTTGKGHSGRPPRPAPSHKAAHDAFSQELGRGIRKLAEHHYEIGRSTLDLALGNLGVLAKWVRVAPEVREGKPVGFRLFAITADGPFAKLGLRNGDVLIAINGLDLATPERVLEAYSKLRTAPHLILGLLREGREITQDYTIR